MNHRFLLFLIGLVLLLAGWDAHAAEASRPNVLLIILDDHAPDWSELVSGSQVKTPNLRRLAGRSVNFSRAYAPAPSCCPSRTSLWTGVEPHRSGVYLNNHAYRRTPTWISRAVNLPQHFQKHGYLAAGYGKTSHHDFQEDDTTAWSEGHFQPLSNEEDLEYGQHARPNTIVPDSFSFYQWGPLPDDWDRGDPLKQQQDTRNTNRAIALVGRAQQKPFFCALGLFRPHLRWYVPQRFFDLYPLDAIKEPPGLRWDDLDDVPASALKMRRPVIFNAITSNGLWKPALQAYMASVTYADEQIGRVLDALEQGPHARNTVVVLVSDNGWHNGDKMSFSKFTLWEQATKVTCLISVPGQAPGVCNSPVSLVDLFPTLNRLCGLPPPESHPLDGVDLTAVLADPRKDRGRPILTTQGVRNHAVRSRDFRYIRYADGAEELYDHRSDPYEWRNLAGDSRFAANKAELARWLPTKDAEPIPASGPAPR